MRTPLFLRLLTVTIPLQTEAAVTAQGNGVIINLGLGNSLTLNGVDVDDVANINFVF